MADRERRSLQVLLETPRADTTDRELLCEIVLMVALADGMIPKMEFDRIARNAISHAELQELDWDWLTKRADQLRDDAPFFSETREVLVAQLSDQRRRRIGLSLAAKIVAAIRPLQDEEKALLYRLSKAFKIPDKEAKGLFRPWKETVKLDDDQRFCHFNVPRSGATLNLFDSISSSPNADQLQLLVHKLNAARSVLTSFESADLASVGDMIRVGPFQLRIDALIEAEERYYAMRFLAPKESMHPLERKVWEMLFDQFDTSATFFLGHCGLSKADKQFVKRFESPLVRVEKIEI